MGVILVTKDHFAEYLLGVLPPKYGMCVDVVVSHMSEVRKLVMARIPFSVLGFTDSLKRVRVSHLPYVRQRKVQLLPAATLASSCKGRNSMLVGF